MNYPHKRPLAPRVGPLAPAREEDQQKKRKISACQPCRERKIACNGTWPICASCKIRQSSCHYIVPNELETQLQALRRDNNELHGLIDHLRTRPEYEAMSTLQRLRISNSAQSILSSVISGNSRRTIQHSFGNSPHSALTNVPSGSRNNPNVANLNAYSALDLSMEAIIANKTPIDPLFRPVNQLSHTSSSGETLHEGSPQSASFGAFTAPPSTNSFLEQNNDNSNDMDNGFQVCSETVVNSDVIRPQYSDALFSKPWVKFWTIVPVTENFAAAVVMQYLETDHLVYGLFDAQLFVKGLTQFQEDFCSPFLVSALLALGCQAYTAKDPEAAAMSYEFEREAELVCRAELKDSILNAAALWLLYLSYAGHGRHENECSEKASEMAKRLRLFGVRSTLDAKEIQSVSKERQCAVSQTAWGVFNLYILQVQHYLANPTEFPPMVPMPNEVEIEDMSNVESKAHHFHHTKLVFSYICKISVLQSQIFLLIRDPSFGKAPPQAFAESKYRQLLDLMDTLPEVMIRGPGSTIAVLYFHIRFHAVVLDLYRPFVTKEYDEKTRPSYYPSDRPEIVISTTVYQLKGIVIESITRQKAAAHSLTWHVSLYYLFNAIITKPLDEQWRFYFILIIHAYSTLYICYPIVKKIVQSLLTVAVNRDVISKAEAMKVIQVSFYRQETKERTGTRPEEISDQGQDQHPGMKPKITFLMDLDVAYTNREAASIDNLAKKFEDMSVFDEFTTGIV